MELTGGCYCGKLRYAAKGKPAMKAQCHCRECQYITGGAPNMFMLMPVDGFAYTKGAPKQFTRNDLARPVTREFCGECGTHLATRPPGLPFVVLKIGTLDFTMPSGETVTVKGAQPGPHGEFRINDWDVLGRTLSRGDIGLGEAYIDGMWETRDIETLVSLFLMNMDAFDSFANGSFIQRIGFVIYDALLRRNTVKGARRNIQDHYDVGNDFYSLWLDKSMTYSSAIWEAGDSLEQAQSRKIHLLLDRLHLKNGQTLNELCDGLAMTRQAVTKHLGILEAANLVTTLRHGREKLHYLNPVPIHQIGERWIKKFERGKLAALSELKRQLEKRDE